MVRLTQLLVAWLSTLVVSLLAPSSALGQAGTLDPTFNATDTPGTLTFGDALTDESVLATTIDQLGRILVAYSESTSPVRGTLGFTELRVRRFLADGAVDLDFAAGSYLAESVPYTGGVSLTTNEDFEVLLAYSAPATSSPPSANVGFRIERIDFSGILSASTTVQIDLTTNGLDRVHDLALCSDTLFLAGDAESSTGDAGDAVLMALDGLALTPLSSFANGGLAILALDQGGDLLDSAAAVTCSALGPYLAGTTATTTGSAGFVAAFDTAGVLRTGFGSNGIQLLASTAVTRGAPQPAPHTVIRELLLDDDGLLWPIGDAHLDFAEPTAVATVLTTSGQSIPTFGTDGWISLNWSDNGPSPDTFFAVAATSSGTRTFVGWSSSTTGSQLFGMRVDAATGEADQTFGQLGIALYPSADLTSVADAVADRYGRLVIGATAIASPSLDGRLLRIRGDEIFIDAFEDGSTASWSVP